jgi:putative ABC transport system permease protein
MSILLPNARNVLRRSWNRPGFVTSALLTTVLSIAANTPILGLVRAAVQPLPMPTSQIRRLIPVAPVDFCPITKCRTVSYPGDTRPELIRNHPLLRGSQELAFTLTGRGEPDLIVGATVPAPLFSHLGVKPLLGRLFLPDDNRPGAAPAILISERLWRRRFNSDPKLLGASVVLNGQPCSVIGILPANFRFPFQSDPVELWVPLFDSPNFRIWLTQRKLARLKIDG